VSDRLLTAREVADLINVSTETILRWTRRGELPAIRLPGGAIRFRPAEVDAWLVERATAAGGSVTRPQDRRPPGKLAVSPVPKPQEV
jgi:excisionase family DNA binding protein